MWVTERRHDLVTRWRVRAVARDAVRPGTIARVTGRSRRYASPGRDHRTHLRFTADEYAALAKGTRSVPRRRRWPGRAGAGAVGGPLRGDDVGQLVEGRAGLAEQVRWADPDAAADADVAVVRQQLQDRTAGVAGRWRWFRPTTASDAASDPDARGDRIVAPGSARRAPQVGRGLGKRSGRRAVPAAGPPARPG